jgi:phosphorylcholine metabolism protein LicD
MGKESYKRNRAHAYKIYKNCVVCHSDENLTCHHIVNRRDIKYGLFPKDFPLHYVSNLIILCQTCHTEVHQKTFAAEKEEKTLSPIVAWYFLTSDWLKLRLARIIKEGGEKEKTKYPRKNNSKDPYFESMARTGSLLGKSVVLKDRRI